MMALPFTKAEYQRRLDRVRQRMAAAGLDGLIVGDVANQNYLTGYDGWSFYTPQIVALDIEGGEPMWIGREMDAVGGRLTAHMPGDDVIGYPEIYVQTGDRHPGEWIARYLAERGWDGKRIGYEPDAYFYSTKTHGCLVAGLPNAEFVDADLLVNWVRAEKSAAELAYMRQAADLVGHVMRTAFDVIRPGVRQCDAIGEIYKTQMSGHPDIAGDITGLCPLIMAGEAASAPHIMWSEAPFEPDQTCAIELGAAVRHYSAGLARTLHLGKPPARLVDTAKVVRDGLDAALATVGAGVTGGEVEAAWRAVITRHGLEKTSRIGYAIGLGYPPDWGEHTISLRAGETTVLEPDNTLHLMLGMWFDGWGMELSETIRVTDGGVECLTDFPRDIHVVG